MGFLGLYILCGLFSVKKGVFEQVGYSSKDLGRLLIVFFASVAALLVNPYGWRLIGNPFDMLLNMKTSVANRRNGNP